MGASGAQGGCQCPGRGHQLPGNAAASWRSGHPSARSGGPAARQACPAGAAASSGGGCARAAINYTGVSTNCEGCKALSLSENQRIYKKNLKFIPKFFN